MSGYVQGRMCEHNRVEAECPLCRPIEQPTRENVYTCPKCGGYTVTIDVDEGVTPFMLRCRADESKKCDGMAMSAGYPKGPRPPHIPEPAWEWYRPVLAEQQRLERKYPGMMEHFKQGGLHLRRRVVLGQHEGGNNG